MSKDISLILMRNLVIFPNQEVKIDFKSEISKKIIEQACNEDASLVLVVAPLNDKNILPKVGVVAKVLNKIELTNNNLRVNFKGIKRVVVEKYYNKNSKDILNAKIMDIEIPKLNSTQELALKRKLIDLLKEYINRSPEISNAIISSLENTRDLNGLTDKIVSFMNFETGKKLTYMQMINPLKRAESLAIDLQKEIEVLKLEEKINEKVSESIDVGQREYILREKLKEIKNELGEKSLKDEDIEKFNSIIDTLHLNERTYKKLKNEILKYEVASEMSPETNVLRNYIDLVLNLPWNNTSVENTNIDKIKKSLNKTHYGLEEIKQRVVEYAGVKKLNPDINNPIICLVGPPGVGKTSIASSIASALNREFIKISVGGLNDSTELIGSRRTYLGASPGKIIQSIKKCGTKNPVILIDEVDKMVKDYKGDPASTLLEILDPIQNTVFVDNYIEEPFDLSKVFFILTANIESDIPSTLIDRLEIINLNSYTSYDKLSITKKYLLPKIFKDYGINKINIDDEILNIIINNYTYESGVRDLDRILRKYIRRVILDDLNVQDIKTILGEYKYKTQNVIEDTEPGVSNALAYTPLGGIVTKIETVKMHGTGNIIITGMPGKTLEESVSVALDFLKTNYSMNMSNSDIHIHFLDATSKKDGPSAGAAIAIALMSLYLDKSIPSNVAFTGEISLRGNISKVGGIKEKIIGAINAGITTIYIPEDNLPDLESIPKKIMRNIDIIGVKTYNQIYKDVFKL